MGKSLPKKSKPIDDREIENKFMFLSFKGLNLLKKIDKILVQSGTFRRWWGREWLYTKNINDPSHSTIAVLYPRKKLKLFRITNKFEDKDVTDRTLQKIISSCPNLKDNFRKDLERYTSEKGFIFYYEENLSEQEIIEAYDIICQTHLNSEVT